MFAEIIYELFGLVALQKLFFKLFFEYDEKVELMADV